MPEILDIIRSNYTTIGQMTPKAGKYVDVDPDKFQGSWTGQYANKDRFSIQVSDVQGFRAKVRYQSGAITKYQDVLIKDNAFRIGDSKFTLTRDGVAQVKTVVTNPATGGQSLETAYAQQN